MGRLTLANVGFEGVARGGAMVATLANVGFEGVARGGWGACDPG
ncbi:hypothetical protein [uncultured Murdochiella sp.]|nr:hypothetical protein [uncultured Murdochiella sp.]